MNVDEKIAAYKREWERQILSVTGTGTDACRITELADLNGLLDPLRVFYAAQKRLGTEFEKVLYENLPELYAR